MWAMRRFSFAAVSAAAIVLFVSPKTMTQSGFSRTSSGSSLIMACAVCTA
jgi:hypothetical protein